MRGRATRGPSSRTSLRENQLPSGGGSSRCGPEEPLCRRRGRHSSLHELFMHSNSARSDFWHVSSYLGAQEFMHSAVVHPHAQLMYPPQLPPNDWAFVPRYPLIAPSHRSTRQLGQVVSVTLGAGTPPHETPEPPSPAKPAADSAACPLEASSSVASSDPSSSPTQPKPKKPEQASASEREIPRIRFTGLPPSSGRDFVAFATSDGVAPARHAPPPEWALLRRHVCSLRPLDSGFRAAFSRARNLDKGVRDKSQRRPQAGRKLREQS